jgi:hypothetical protein
MRRLSSALVALVFSLVAAPVVHADARVVARGEAVGNPVFAGDDVLYAGLDARRTVVVRRSGAGVVARLSRLGRDQTPWVTLAGSATHLGISRIDVPESDTFTFTEALLAGPREGPLGSLPFHCPGDPNNVPTLDAGQSIAIDGARLAYVRETCAGSERRRQAIVRDMSTGAEQEVGATSGTSIALAGQFVAYRDPANEDRLQVYDLDRGQVALTVPAGNLTGFDVQGDGKLAVASNGDSACDGEISWYAPGNPTPHPIPPDCGAIAPLALEGDRIAYVGVGYSSGGSLRVRDLAGGERLNVHAEYPETGGHLGFDGERLTFGTRGCSFDTGRVWVADLSQRRPSLPKPPRCRAEIGPGPLQLDSRERVVVRIACPTGCRGDVRLATDNRRRLGLGPARSFELRRGGRTRLRLDARGAERLLRGRRTTTVRVEASLDQGTDDLGEFSRRVELHR